MLLHLLGSIHLRQNQGLARCCAQLAMGHIQTASNVRLNRAQACQTNMLSTTADSTPSTASGGTPTYGYLPAEDRVHLHPKVRDLYRRLMVAGQDYPQGLDYVRRKAKPWIAQNAELTDETEIKKKIAIGRFYVRELFAVINLKKYRTMKRRYNKDQ